MLYRLALALLVASEFAAEAQYITGPRGGCYTISSSGRKRYVDRSMCSGGAADNSASSRQNASATALAPSVSGAAKSSVSAGEQEAARKLLEWFQSPAQGDVERAVKNSLAKRLGLAHLLASADVDAR